VGVGSKVCQQAGQAGREKKNNKKKKNRPIVSNRKYQESIDGGQI
jgi:hypothetical protein